MTLIGNSSYFILILFIRIYYLIGNSIGNTMDVLLKK